MARSSRDSQIPASAEERFIHVTLGTVVNKSIAFSTQGSKVVSEISFRRPDSWLPLRMRLKTLGHLKKLRNATLARSVLLKELTDCVRRAVVVIRGTIFEYNAAYHQDCYAPHPTSELQRASQLVRERDHTHTLAGWLPDITRHNLLCNGAATIP